MQRIKALLIIVLLIYSCITPAKELTQYAGSWLGAVTTHPFKKDSKWNYVALVQVRLLAKPTSYQQSLFKGGVFYKLSKHWLLGFGYYFFNNNIPSHNDFNTQRLYQDATGMMYFPKHQINLSLRSMLEERFRAGNYPTALRLREMLSLTHTISKKVTLLLEDEVFISLVNPAWTGTETFDQNRLFLLFRSPLTKHLKIDYGYLNQYLPRKHTNYMNHLLVIMLKF